MAGVQQAQQEQHPRQHGVVAVPIVEEPHVVRPPAMRARKIALILSCVAVMFSLACGVSARRAYAFYKVLAPAEKLFPWVTAFLVLLLIALLLRGGAAVCELWWLERTWSNLPERLRKVGPVKEVSSALAIAVSFVPGVAWVWKLGLIVGIANGFEAIRTETGFQAPVPKRLGMAAIIIGWVPGLNVYIAPFLWELFARKIDVCVTEILAKPPVPSGEPTTS
jgi:hypothetical protein